MNDIEETLRHGEQRNNNSIEALKKELNAFRTGRANPLLLENVMVDYYGTLTPLNQLASISVPEARLIIVQPWDLQSVSPIEKSIQQTGSGLNPVVDGNLLRISIPPLTEDRRKEMVKQIKQRIESGKVEVRNIRREGIEQLRRLEKTKEISQDESRRGQDQIQKITDSYVNQIDALGEEKEKEVMEV